MKGKITNIIKSTLSLLVIISILLSNPVHAEEIRLNSGVDISVRDLDNIRFEIKRNVYSNGNLLFSKGTVGSRNVGHIVDANGHYHYFSSTVKQKDSFIKKHGPTALKVAGVAAAAAVAVPLLLLYAVSTTTF